MYYYFDRSVMMDEEGRVKAIFLVFTLSYISRAILYLLNQFIIDEVANTYLVYYTFYPIWDVLPLSLIMVYHRTCYEAQYAELMRLKQEAEDEANRESVLTTFSSVQESSVQEQTTRQATETTNDRQSLIDSVYEQRMADIEAREAAEAQRSTEGRRFDQSSLL